MALKIIFMGTPEFSVPTLVALHEAGHQIVACYSQPPRPAGRRGLELIASPVQQQAEKLAIPVFNPTTFKNQETMAAFEAHNADVAVVVAYGMLLPQSVLDAPRLGCFNGHASLLPRWRGAAPLQRAIMAGDHETGMMVMKMEKGLDTGPIALTSRVPIDDSMTSGKLHDKLSHDGAQLMVKAMDLLEQGRLELTLQPEDGVTYASKINKHESRIDWTKPALQVQRHIMGLSPFPGAWCEMRLGDKIQRVKVLEAKMSDEIAELETLPGTVLDEALRVACKDGSIHLTRLQRAGSKAMSVDEFLRGNALVPGTVIF